MKDNRSYKTRCTELVTAYKPRLKLRYAIICASLCYANAAYAHQTNEELPSPAPSTGSDSLPESPAAGTRCPDHDDARKSIDEGKKILAEAQEILKDPQTSDFSARIHAVQNQLLVWREHNDALKNGCQMLLGVNGVSVYPEIPMALENLTQGRACIEKSMEAAGLGELSSSELYVKAGDKAIKLASKVIDQRLKPDRRAAENKTREQSEDQKSSDIDVSYMGDAPNDGLAAASDIGILGLRFEISADRVPEILTICPDSPAAKGDLRKGDVIEEVNGITTKNLDKQNIYQMVTGKPDTEVILKIQRGAIVFTKSFTRMHLVEFAKLHPEILY